MKIGYLFVVGFVMVLGVGNWMGEDVEEKSGINLDGVWEMCLYGCNCGDIGGEVKRSNCVKIVCDEGGFRNLLMMERGGVILGYGSYEIKSEGVYRECVEKKVDVGELNGKKKEMDFDLKENGRLMYVKYLVDNDGNGKRIDWWCDEMWKKVEMGGVYGGDELG